MPLDGISTTQAQRNREALKQIAKILNMPCREQRRWDSATKREKHAICYLAMDKVEFKDYQWYELTDSQKAHVNRAFSRISELSRYGRLK